MFSLQQVADAGIAIILLVAFSLVIAGSSVYIVNERVNGEKLQQKLCGVSFKTYWGVSFVWDITVTNFLLNLSSYNTYKIDIYRYTALLCYWQYVSSKYLICQCIRLRITLLESVCFCFCSGLLPFQWFICARSYSAMPVWPTCTSYA